MYVLACPDLFIVCGRHSRVGSGVSKRNIERD
jgi:hypothetical protein